MFEGGIRGVGFVTGGIIEGVRSISKRLIHVSDWFPTLVHLAGGDTNDLDLDGHNVWGAIRYVIHSTLC